MSTDTPTPERETCPDGVPVEHELGHLPDHCPTCAEGTPERVTLTDEEREALSWGVHDARSGGLPREDCTGCGPIADRLGPVIERIIAAREQALREEIAGQIEAKYLGPDSGRGYDGREAPDAALRNAYDEGLEAAACVARGGAR